MPTNQHDLSLANAALNMLGADRLTSLDNTTNNRVIDTVNQFLPLAKQETLRARDWNRARGRETLNEITNESEGEWSQAYAPPTDMLCMRHFASSIPQVRFAKYSVETNAQDKPILYTSCSTNKIVYTKNLTDVNRWDPLMFNAAVIRLAWYMAGAIVRDFKAQQAKLGELQALWEEAVGVDEGEGGLDEVYDRTLVSVRQ